MKLKQFLSTWSRKLHRWIGLYSALVVMIYTIEAFTLPLVFSDGLSTVDGSPPITIIKQNPDSVISIEQITEVFKQQHPQGVNSFDEIDEIAYLPTVGVYRFANTERFFEWYIDAYSGELLKYGFKADLFLEEQNLFGWWQPWIHTLVEFPMLLLLVILAVSGVYLFAIPLVSKKNVKSQLKTDIIAEDSSELAKTQLLERE